MRSICLQVSYCKHYPTSFQPRTILNLDIEYEHSDGDTSESEAFETEPSHEDIKASFFRLLRCPHEFQDFDAACLILSQMLSILPEDDECVSMIYEIYDNLVELQENPPADNPYSVPFVTRSNENENIARLLALVVGYEEQYGLEGKLSDLERAIGCIERVIELTDEDHPCFPEYLGILGNFLLARFEHLGDTQYLADAIYEQERAVSLVLDTRPNLCSDLGYSLLRRYRVFGELEDLDGAIENQEKAICAATNENKDTSIWIIRLADSLLLRFERLGHQADANKAVELYERVLPVNPHPDQRPAILNNLGSALQKRFMHFRNLEDINRAIRRQDEAVALTPETHINMPIWLTNLGNSLQLRFEHSSALEDIELAISHQEHALRILPQGHALNSSVLNDLGNSLRLRFGWSGEPADINQAITWLSKSVELTAVGHTERPRWLDSLGNALRQKFEMIGDLIDIDKAITVLSEAVSCSTDGHIDQPDRFNHLGNAYISRFDRLGEASDVENAIECHRKAISLDSQGGVKRISLLGDLASSLLTRFRIFRNLLDVDEAIASQREAIGVCPPGHSAMPALLSNLGGFFQTRYRHTKELEDLSESISCLKNSINLTPDDHVDKPSSYCLLGSSYEERFRRLDELDDINQAVEFHTSAVNLTPEYHMDRAAFLYELANCIALRCYTTSDTTDLDLATDTYRRAALSPVGKPMVRFRAAHKWALTAMRYRVEPLEAYRAALDIIPQVVWLGTTINRRYQDISSIGNFITDAVANAISSQEYDLALEWLEEGRSIVWQQMLQLRTPMDDLRSVDPSRADQLEQLARTLERAGSSKVAQGHSRTADPELSGEEAAQAHRRLAEEWANSVEQVRELPGFSDFLRPRKASTLMKAAQNGPVVAINVQSGRCDALVINPGTMHVSCVPLPNLTYAKAASAQKSLIRSLQLAGVRFRAERRPIKRSAPPVEHKIEDVLEFLWVDVVEPVLTYLNYLVSTTYALGRIVCMV